MDTFYAVSEPTVNGSVAWNLLAENYLKFDNHCIKYRNLS